MKGEAIAAAQGIPQNFLENILADLRHAGLVKSQRGAEGGYRLARPAGEVSVADVIRAVEGPLAAVRGEAPEDVSYAGAAAPLQDVWIAVRANLRAVVEHVYARRPRGRARARGGRPAGRGSGRAPQALTGAFPFARSHTTSRSDSSSSSAWSRVSCAVTGPASPSSSSTRTSKPRCTTRLTIASRVPSPGSRSDVRCRAGARARRARRLTGPRNSITKRFAGRS